MKICITDIIGKREHGHHRDIDCVVKLINQNTDHCIKKVTQVTEICTKKNGQETDKCRRSKTRVNRKGAVEISETSESYKERPTKDY